MNLDELRQRIDELDGDLIALLNERTRLAMEIGKLKRDQGGEIYVPTREKAVLERVASKNEGPLEDSSIRAIYREIMSASISLERHTRIAYLGPPATFTHQAARSRFGASVEYTSCSTVADVFAAVQKQQTDYGVVPIENSTEGAVNPTLDELTATPLKIYAEIFLPVCHHLMSNQELANVTKVYSHPQVFGQCRAWMAQYLPGIDMIPVSSTARAAELAAAEPNAAAVASELAAEVHGLGILYRDIQDQAGNTTRFLVIARGFGPSTGDDKTSIVFAVNDKVGALYEALAGFRRHELNLTKIESRPSKMKAWEYLFFVDFEGHAEDDVVREALEVLSEHCLTMTVLGSYPRARIADQVAASDPDVTS